MNTQEQVEKRAKIYKLKHIQREGIGNHIAVDHNLQKELDLKLVEEELK